MKNILFTILLLAPIHFTGHAFDFDDINGMEPVGHGRIKYMGLIKVYDATLYTQDETVNGRILDPDITKCLKLKYSVAISADDIIEGANTILSRQHHPLIIAQNQDYIDRIHASMQDVKGGDSYTLCYNGETQKTHLFFNEQHVESISSVEFSSMYFGIWLGQKAPIDMRLRDQLLASATGK